MAGRPEGPLEEVEELAALVGRACGAVPDPGRLACGELAEWARATPLELKEQLRLSLPAARRLVAAFELGRRVEGARRPARPCLRSPARVFRLLEPEVRGLRREVFFALLLDGKHRLRRVVRVSEGTLTTSLVHPREFFGPALREGAAAVVAAHNHPSGDPDPSVEDLEVTRRLAECGRLLGIPLLDHVVLGRGRFASLRERLPLVLPA